MDNATFQARLYDRYGGEVIAIEKYLNYKSVIRFHCGKCNVVFFAKPRYLLESSHQRHMCGHSFRMTGGARHKADHNSASEKIRVKLLKRQQKEIHTLLENNVSVLFIALKMDLNVSTIRWHIENESKKELNSETLG